jgi:glutamate carboxypeptidase
MPLLPVQHFEALQPEVLDALRRMVEMESPTTDKESVDRLGRWFVERLAALGGLAKRLPQKTVGDQWLVRWGSGKGGTLLLHHLDTVHPLGTIAERPWRVEGGRAYGPGALDMKGGLAITLGALAGLLAGGTTLPRLTCLLTSDEETGSHASRALIEDAARRHDRVLCLEPASAGGGLKTSRKATGVFVLEATGRAAHAGNDPEQGINAILEIALQIPRVHALAAPATGTTVSVGVIEGGTRANVIPERCRVRIDVRASRQEEMRRVELGLGALEPAVQGARLALRGGWNRPPMARTPGVAALFEQARELGGELGLQIAESSAGGGSDANFVAAIGAPVLDGLGARGDGAHSAQEFVEIDSLPERAALLAGLITAG